MPDGRLLGCAATYLDAGLPFPTDESVVFDVEHASCASWSVTIHAK